MFFEEHDIPDAEKAELPKVLEPEKPAKAASHRVPVKHVRAAGTPSRTEAMSEQKIDESLRAIYEEDGEMPDLTKLEHKKSRRLIWVLAGLALLGVIAGAAWVGFLLFAPFVAKTTPKLTLRIEAPDSIAALEPTHVTIHYENLSNQPISGVEIRANLPAEFMPEKASPEPTSPPNIWMLGSLEPGEQGDIDIDGSFLADPGSHVYLQGIVKYRPANFNSDFQDIATKSVDIEKAKLDISLEAPAEAVSGEVVKLIYTLKNGSENAIEGLTLEPKLPESFIVSSSEPKLEKGAPILFKIDKLASTGESVITIQGVFTSDHGASENIGGFLRVTRNGVTSTQAETVTTIRVIASDLTLRTIVNGSTENQTVDFGGVLRVSTIYKNNGERAMKDLVITINLDATPDGLIDWAKFDEDTEADKTFKRTGESIIVNGKLLKSFTSVEPGTEGTLSYTLPLMKTAIKDGKKYQAIVKSKATISAIGTTKLAKSVETTPFTIAANTDLSITDHARYFDEDGVPLGIGPLPPVVGQPTKYQVEWIIGNSIHELKDLSMKTQLPEGVAWTGKSLAEAGSVVWNATTRTVEWKLQRLQTSTTSVAVQFEIELTPSKSQVDSFAPLTTGGTLNATDVVTSAFMTQTTPPDTTELVGDKNAAGKGLVVEK